MTRHRDSAARKNLYYFGWPSWYGGADTKAAHLFRLLNEDFRITVIPNRPEQLEQGDWCRYLDQLGVQYTTFADLPKRLDGIALSLCNAEFFRGGICREVKSRGLRTIFSTEMAWRHEGEIDAANSGELDLLLCVSEVQRKVLDYEQLCDIPVRMTGNYIDPDEFPFVHRNGGPFTIGRLSRADPEKFPVDFPHTYESLELHDTRFRVMAWSNELNKLFRSHRFDDRWEAFGQNQMAAAEFLQSLDLFVYALGPTFLETWGRSTVEAMLTGAIPLVPNGHHFPNLIVHGKTGYICNNQDDFKEHAQRLRRDDKLRRQMSRACRQHAQENLCDRQEHRRVWLEALNI